MMSFEEFLNEALVPMKKYSEQDVIKCIKMFLNKDVDRVPKKLLNYYNTSLYQLKKKYNGYDPLETTHEGDADELYMKILNNVYAKLKKEIH